MKKLILGFAAVAGIATAASAQIKVAPELGINLSTWQNKNDVSTYTSDRIVGLRAGVMVDIPLVGGLSLEPGVMYSGKGGKYTYPIVGETTTTLSYLEIPVNFKYTYDLGNPGKIFGHVGPYFAYAISGQEKDASGTNKVVFGDGTFETKPLDLGLNVGAGYQLPMGLYFRAQYGLGFADTDNITTANSKSTNNSNIALTLGYQF